MYEELEGFAHAIRKHLQDLLGEEVTESLKAKASASKMFQSRNIEQRIRGREITWNPPGTRITNSRSTYKRLKSHINFATTLPQRKELWENESIHLKEDTKWLSDNPITLVELRLSAPKSVYPAVLQ